MNIESEKDSAPSGIEYMKSKGVESTIFDLDNTLFATRERYEYVLEGMGMEIAEYYKGSKSSEIIANEFRDLVFSSHTRRGSKPTLIKIQCSDALDEYLEDERKYLKDEIIGNNLDDFYDVVPDLYERSIPLLRDLVHNNINVAFHSHAQYDWTKKKVSCIKEELKVNYLPFLATDISKEKDKESWFQSFSLVGGYVSSIMVVGDGVEFDLLPAMDAGCKYTVWLNRKGRPIPDILNVYKDNGKYIYMIRDIGELRYLSDDNLI
jgi:FMN phosphatase YigB (HAD superfamily)